MGVCRTPSAVAPRRRRQRQRKRKPDRCCNLDVTVIACAPELDPLTLLPRLDTVQVGRDVAEDPMLLEIVASLSIIQEARGPPPVLATPSTSACLGVGHAEDPMVVEVAASLHVFQSANAPSMASPSDDAVAASDDIDVGALFINSLRLPLQESLLHTPPRAARQEPASLVSRRSVRLAAKAPFRDPNPEKQAKRVFVNKWERRPDHAPIDAPDGRIVVLFHEAFKEPIDSPTREALRELCSPRPARGLRGGLALLIAPASYDGAPTVAKLVRS
jgi:hypothetical protein